MGNSNSMHHEEPESSSPITETGRGANTHHTTTKTTTHQQINHRLHLSAESQTDSDDLNLPTKSQSAGLSQPIQKIGDTMMCENENHRNCSPFLNQSSQTSSQTAALPERRSSRKRRGSRKLLDQADDDDSEPVVGTKTSANDDSSARDRDEDGNDVDRDPGYLPRSSTSSSFSSPPPTTLTNLSAALETAQAAERSERLTSSSSVSSSIATPTTASRRDSTLSTVEVATQRLQQEQPKEVHHKDIQPYDVICGRDKEAFNNIGNRRFRITISLHLPKYLDVSNQNKAAKARVILSLLDLLLNVCGVRFLKRNSPTSQIFQVLEYSEARAKVGHALRDMAQSHRQELSKSKASTPLTLPLKQPLSMNVNGTSSAAKISRVSDHKSSSQAGAAIQSSLSNVASVKPGDNDVHSSSMTDVKGAAFSLLSIRKATVSNSEMNHIVETPWPPGIFHQQKKASPCASSPLASPIITELPQSKVGKSTNRLSVISYDSIDMSGKLDLERRTSETSFSTFGTEQQADDFSPRRKKQRLLEQGSAMDPQLDSSSRVAGEYQTKMAQRAALVRKAFRESLQQEQRA